MEVGGRHRPKLRYACMGFSEVSPLCGFFLRLCRKVIATVGCRLVRLKPQVIGYGLEVGRYFDTVAFGVGDDNT